MNAFAKIGRNKLTVATLMAPVLIVCVFLLLFLPAVRGASDASKTSNFAIAIVNQSSDIGNTIESEVVKNVPFTVKTNLDKKDALTGLRRGDFQMVIVIPRDFATKMQSGHTALDFTINNAVPTSVKTIMETAESQITSAINTAAIGMEKQRVFQGVTTQVAQLPVPTQVKNQLNQIFQNVVINAPSQLVEAHETMVNNSASSIPNILPFLSVVTYFIGSMITTAVSFMLVRSIRTREHNRYAAGVVQFLLNVVVAALIAGVDLLVFHGFGVDPVVNGWTAWGSLLLAFLSMCALIQLFVYLVGLPGLVFGLVLFPVQLLTAGSLLPSQLLPNFYTQLASLLPTPYITGIVSHSFLGGGNFTHDVNSLSIISAVCFAVIFLRLTIRGLATPAQSVGERPIYR